VSLLRALSGAAFRVFERLGFHVTPRHYAFPIPDTGRLDPRLWEGGLDAPAGIDLREDAQIELLGTLAKDHGAEWAAWPRDPDRTNGFHLRNRHFETVDAEIFHGLVRSRKPRRLVEAGSGHSTRLALEAVARNAAEGRPCEIQVYDPYASPWVREQNGRGLTLYPVEVQKAPLETFTALAAGDILFIDSSHVLHIGSDVRFLFGEVIPRLAPGVLVHVHDVFLPAEYPRRWVQGLRFWNEQYLLQAFLAFNDRFRVVWASHFMARKHGEKIAAAVPSFRYDDEPGSFWFERTR
jgi:hypothetical protein